MAHLAGMAIVRRHAFSNEQWHIPGSELLTPIKSDAGDYIADPSQAVSQAPCSDLKSLSLADRLEKMPRAAFDYVWLIDAPAYDARATRGMTLLWRDGNDALFRINH